MNDDLKGKKIAVIENGLFSTYTMREGLMLRLVREGCEVYILTHTNKFVPEVEKMGLKIFNVGSGNMNPFKVARYIYNREKGIKKNKAGCLSHFQYQAGYFWKFNNTPITHTYHH